MFKWLEECLGGFIWVVYLSLTVGWVYWIWLAVKVGGFAMFAIALFPLTSPIASILGAWSFLFGVPEWVVNVFIV